MIDKNTNIMEFSNVGHFPQFVYMKSNNENKKEKDIDKRNFTLF